MTNEAMVNQQNRQITLVMADPRDVEYAPYIIRMSNKPSSNKEKQKKQLISRKGYYANNRANDYKEKVFSY
jgi:hypothetical protein